MAWVVYRVRVRAPAAAAPSPATIRPRVASARRAPASTGTRVDGGVASAVAYSIGLAVVVWALLLPAPLPLLPPVELVFELVLPLDVELPFELLPLALVVELELELVPLLELVLPFVFELGFADEEAPAADPAAALKPPLPPPPEGLATALSPLPVLLELV